MSAGIALSEQSRRTIESHDIDIETSAGWRTFNRHNMLTYNRVIKKGVRDAHPFCIIQFND
jgi:hypothetical protein